MFGTDGIRGEVGQGYITTEFAVRLGYCVSRELLNGQGKVVIGIDTRESSPELADSLAQGLSLGGSAVDLLGEASTPAVAYEVQARQASVGAVITASHNPYQYNGFKFFGPSGSKLTDQEEQKIQTAIAQCPEIDTAVAGRGSIQRHSKPASYLAQVMHYADDIGPTGIRLVVDCANGSLSTQATPILERCGEVVDVVGATPNGANINASCGSTELVPLQQQVITNKADLGIAFDGDADRVLLVDQLGQVVSGDHILYMLAKFNRSDEVGGGGVVGTLMSNGALQDSLDEMAIPFIRSQIGDRYVQDELFTRDWRLGGEPSGHIIRRQVSATGDGLLTALGVVATMKREQRQMHELLSNFELYPQVLLNLSVEDPVSALSMPKVVEATAQVEAQLEGLGRVLVRSSGTEPVVRVMAESSDSELAFNSAKSIADAVLAS